MGTERNTEAEIAAARSRVYHLLAEVFRAEPGPALVEMLRGREFQVVLDELGLTVGQDFAATPIPPLLEGLAVEHTRLFIGPGPHLSPNESVHVRKEGRAGAQFWGPETAEVRVFMAEVGLSLAEDFTGMPDHVTAEFEFMARLAEHEAELWNRHDEPAARRCRAIQQRFLREHVAQWVPGFCDKVAGSTRLDFYRGIAKLAAAVVEFDSADAAPHDSPPPSDAPGLKCCPA